MPDLRLADILKDFELLEIAQKKAFAIVDKDPRLGDHPELAAEIRSMLGAEVEWLFEEARA